MGSWSGLRKAIRCRIVPQLRDRIDLHYTVYTGHCRFGFPESKNWRLWITLDGVEIYSTDFWDIFNHPAISERFQQGRTATFGEARELGGTNVDDALSGIRESLSLPVAQARCSEIPLVRALAWVDIRTGKRTTSRQSPPDEEHPLVIKFRELRREAERDT